MSRYFAVLYITRIENAFDVMLIYNCNNYARKIFVQLFIILLVIKTLASIHFHFAK